MFFFHLRNFLQIAFLLGHSSRQDSVMRRNLLEFLMDHLLYKELTIAKLTNRAPLLDIFAALTEVAFPQILALEVTGLLDAVLAVRISTEGTVGVFQVFRIFPAISARVAALWRVMVHSWIDRSLHKEDALFFVKDVLAVSDAEPATCFQESVKLIKRMANCTRLQVGFTLSCWARRHPTLVEGLLKRV